MSFNLTDKLKKPGALAVCGTGYLAALLAAALVMRLFQHDGHNPVLALAMADLAGTVVIFIFSMLFNNSSFYDPYWSVAPVPIILFLFSISDGISIRRFLIILLFMVWAVRLTVNWARRWRGFNDEDWRYAGYRMTSGRWYWPLSFAGFHLFPTIIVFLGCLPVFDAFITHGSAFNILDVLAFIVATTAIVIESLADQQLWDFKARDRKESSILDSGVWAWSRHPNYFGEILFWWGIWLFSLSNGSPGIHQLIWPVGVTLLFAFISVPMADKRMLRHKPDYYRRMKHIPALIPFPFRRTADHVRRMSDIQPR